MRCAYCLEEALEGTVEHIVPRALDDSECYVLPAGRVCRRCNHATRRLDEAVQDNSYFLMRGAAAGVHHRRKRRKVYKRGDTRAVVEFEPSREVVFPSGATLLPFEYTIEGPAAFDARDGTLTFTADGHASRFDEWRFARGLHKMALGRLCKEYLDASSPDECYGPDLESLRRYVINPRHGREEWWPYGFALGPALPRGPLLEVGRVEDGVLLVRLVYADLWFVMATAEMEEADFTRHTKEFLPPVSRTIWGQGHWR